MKRTFLIIAAVVFGLIHPVAANTKSVPPLIPNSYKIDVAEKKEVSPFCLAIAKGDFEMVKKLIEMGTNVNTYSNKKSPLMYAARYNHVEIAKLLIANGAKITDKDARGRTAIQYAELSNANEVVSLLKGIKKEKKHKKRQNVTK